MDASEYEKALDGKSDVRHPTYPRDVLMYFEPSSVGRDGKWWRRFKHFHKVASGQNAWNRKTTGEADWEKAGGVAYGHYRDEQKAHTLGKPQRQPTFAEEAAHFLDHVNTVRVNLPEPRTKNEKTGHVTRKRANWYRKQLETYVLPYIGSFEHDEVDNAAIELMRQKHYAGKPMPVEAHGQRGVLVRQVLRHGVEMMGVKSGRELPKLPPRSTGRRADFEATDQWPRLVAHLWKRANQSADGRVYQPGSTHWHGRRMLALYVLTIGYTGARTDEVRNLRFRDFGSLTGIGDPGQIRFDGKNGKGDYFDEDGLMRAVIAEIHKIHPSPDDLNSFLFVTKQGKPCGQYRLCDALRELQALHPDEHWTTDDQGQTRSCYSARHMFVTCERAKGTPDSALKHMVRTSVYQINRHYGHNTAQQMRDLRVRGAIPPVLLSPNPPATTPEEILKLYAGT